ncbi:acyltransferase [bacterium]|nr:acyltransferase [candidate division CSSED10-310 bacterium]
MRLGYMQMNPVWGNPEANLMWVESKLPQTPCEMMVLPEFFNTGYLFTDKSEVEKFSETIPEGCTFKRLLELAKKTQTHIIAGLPEKDDDCFFNTAICLHPDSSWHKYRKTHLFDREKLFFSPGDTGFEVFTINRVKIGMMICFDWLFPESARTLALKGAQVLAHPSNLVLPHCPSAMITRCIENRVFAITCNRIGTESNNDLKLTFIGNSRIISPKGKILAASSDDKEDIQVVEVNPHEADDKYITERNNIFNDRRSIYYLM